MSGRWGARRRFAALLAFASGCVADGVPEPPRITTSDSAGILLHTFDRVPPLDDPDYLWSVELERSLPTAGPDPLEPPLLYRPQALLRLDDGTLVVLDGGPERLVVIDSERDSATARFGRPGQGPGEIRSGNGLLWPGEPGSFWLLDPGNQRTTRFALDGTVLEEGPVSLAGSGGLAKLRPRTHEALFWRNFLVDSTGLIADSVVAFDAATNRAEPVAPMPPRHASRSHNWSAFPYFAPKGTFAPIVPEGVVTGRTDLGELRWFGDDGALRAIMRLPLHTLSLSLDEKAWMLGEMAQEYSPAARATHEDLADELPLWSLLWPLGDSTFALEHTRWAHPANDPSPEPLQRVWRVLGVDGSYRGVIRFPTAFGYPYSIEDGRVTAVRADSLGVAIVETYRVEEPPPARR